MTDQVATSRDQVSAKILPFAQREVVDRFLVGIDPDLESGINGYFASAQRTTEKNLFDGLRLSAKTKKAVLQNLKNSLGVAVGDFDNVFMTKTKEAYSKETEDMVLFMSKQESAHLAEALMYSR